MANNEQWCTYHTQALTRCQWLFSVMLAGALRQRFGEWWSYPLITDERLGSQPQVLTFALGVEILGKFSIRRILNLGKKCVNSFSKL